MLRRLLGLTVLTAVAAIASAGPQNYATKVQNIRAGIVVLAGDQVGGAIPYSAAPFAFYNLDSNTTVKPAGWNFYNPHAPSAVTNAIKGRWPIAAVGSPITKKEAPYWEVFLGTASDLSINDYDVLLVAPNVVSSLTPAERDRLRRFVDNGGTLWIDPGTATGAPDLINNFPIPFSTFASAGVTNLSDFSQPMLNVPNTLTFRDMNILATGFGTQFALAPITYPAALAPFYEGMVQDFGKLQPISLINGKPWISFGKIGDGYEVITARGAAQMLNRGSNTVANTGYRALNPALQADGLAAGKLAINMVSLGAEYRMTSGGARKSNSTAIDLGAPLLRRFQAEGTAASNNLANTPPVLYKGVVVMSVGNRLVAYDADPGSDLDGDGDPDDGVRDYSIGDTMDRIWTSVPLTGPISSPVCVEVPNGNGVPLDQVLVVDGNGQLNVFDLFTGVGATGHVLGSEDLPLAYGPIGPGGASFTIDAPPNAPTVHEGIAYIADRVISGSAAIGRIWCADLRNPAAAPTGWAIGGSNLDQLPDFSAPPTIGYVPITDNTGGADRVAYVPYRAPGGFGPTNTPGLISLWIGARGEKPASVELSDPSYVEVMTRAGRSNLPVYTGSSGTSASVGVRLSLVHTTGSGNPYSASEMATYFTGQIQEPAPGVLRFMRTGAALPATFNGDSDVRVDYTVDWGTGGIASIVARGRVNFPEIGGAVAGSIAMSPRGTIYANVNRDPKGGGSGGSFFAFREGPRGSFKMVARWELYNRHNATVNQGQTISNPPVLEDVDPVTSFSAFIRGDMSNFAFTGPPAVRDGQVYMTANAVKNTFVPVTIVMAMNAEPNAPEIRVGDLPDGFQIVQPDLARSQNFGIGSTPEQVSAMRSGTDFTYDHDTGVVRFESLMSGSGGQIQNSLSLSQPVILRVPGQPDRQIAPEATGGHWSPLTWFATFNGLQSSIDLQANSPVGQKRSGPLVTGGTLFLTGQSYISDILAGKPFGTWSNHGHVFAMDAKISPTDRNLVGLGTRPWLKQATQLTPTFAPSPSFLWPQIAGNTSINDYFVRILGTRLGNSTTAYGVVGGEGALVAWGGIKGITTSVGIYGFSRADLMVADEGRVARFDPAGNPVWTATAGADSGNLGGGAAANTARFVRPTRAYTLGAQDALIVDTGGNKVVRVDKIGLIKRLIADFILDSGTGGAGGHLPAGWRANDPLTLDSPRDVLTFSEYHQKGANEEVTLQQPIEYWTHYVVADGGNHRLIELVDRYAVDANRRIGNAILVNNVPQLGVLLWKSPPEVSGKNFEYNSISRVFLNDVNGARYVYVAGIGNALPARVDLGLDTPTTPNALREAGEGTGGVIIFDPAYPAAFRVINEIDVPSTMNTDFWYSAADLAGNLGFNPGAYHFSTLPLPLQQKLSYELGQHVRRLSGVNAVTSHVIDDGGVPKLAVMISDNSGVYEVLENPNSSTWSVRWMLPSRAYRYMRRAGASPFTPLDLNPLGFRPMYARRLDSGGVLLVNGYMGKDLGGTDFGGEILELTGELDLNNTGTGFSPLNANLGFNSFSVQYQLPPINRTRGLVLPVFADRK